MESPAWRITGPRGVENAPFVCGTDAGSVWFASIAVWPASMIRSKAGQIGDTVEERIREPEGCGPISQEVLGEACLRTEVDLSGGWGPVPGGGMKVKRVRAIHHDTVVRTDVLAVTPKQPFATPGAPRPVATGSTDSTRLATTRAVSIGPIVVAVCGVAHVARSTRRNLESHGPGCCVDPVREVRGRGGRKLHTDRAPYVEP